MTILKLNTNDTPTKNITCWQKNGPCQIIFRFCVRKDDRCCDAGGVCIYHIGPFKRKHRIYYTTRRLLFFIPVDSRRAVLCVRSCACVGQCLLLFSPYSFTHAAAAEYTRDELPVIVSSCMSNDTNFIFAALFQ